MSEKDLIARMRLLSNQTADFSTLRSQLRGQKSSTPELLYVSFVYKGIRTGLHITDETTFKNLWRVAGGITNVKFYADPHFYG